MVPMTTLRLALDFSTDNPDEITSPVARIYVVGKFPRGGDRFTYLSKDCASASELDESIEFLKKELEIIRAEGHRKFKASKGL